MTQSTLTKSLSRHGTNQAEGPRGTRQREPKGEAS